MVNCLFYCKENKMGSYVLVNRCPKWWTYSPHGQIFTILFPSKQLLFLQPFANAGFFFLFDFRNINYFLSASQTATHLRSIIIYARQIATRPSLFIYGFLLEIKGIQNTGHLDAQSISSVRPHLLKRIELGIWSRKLFCIKGGSMAMIANWLVWYKWEEDVIHEYVHNRPLLPREVCKVV